MVPLCLPFFPAIKPVAAPPFGASTSAATTTLPVASRDRAAQPPSSYRWYAFHRRISRMRPEQAIAVWDQVAEAVLNHEISQEWVFRIMNRYTARVMELGARMRQRPA